MNTFCLVSSTQYPFVPFPPIPIRTWHCSWLSFDRLCLYISHLAVCSDDQQDRWWFVCLYVPAVQVLHLIWLAVCLINLTKLISVSQCITVGLMFFYFSSPWLLISSTEADFLNCYFCLACFLFSSLNIVSCKVCRRGTVHLHTCCHHFDLKFHGGNKDGWAGTDFQNEEKIVWRTDVSPMNLAGP